MLRGGGGQVQGQIMFLGTNYGVIIQLFQTLWEGQIRGQVTFLMTFQGLIISIEH